MNLKMTVYQDFDSIGSYNIRLSRLADDFTNFVYYHMALSHLELSR